MLYFTVLKMHVIYALLVTYICILYYNIEVINQCFNIHFITVNKICDHIIDPCSGEQCLLHYSDSSLLNLLPAYHAPMSRLKQVICDGRVVVLGLPLFGFSSEVITASADLLSFFYVLVSW